MRPGSHGNACWQPAAPQLPVGLNLALNPVPGMHFWAHLQLHPASTTLINGLHCCEHTSGQILKSQGCISTTRVLQLLVFPSWPWSLLLVLVLTHICVFSTDPCQYTGTGSWSPGSSVHPLSPPVVTGDCPGPQLMDLEVLLRTPTALKTTGDHNSAFKDHRVIRAIGPVVWDVRISCPKSSSSHIHNTLIL